MAKVGDGREKEEERGGGGGGGGGEGENLEDFDSILTCLGTGKWNLMFLICMGYWYSLLPYHTVAGAFISPFVAHNCSTGTATLATPDPATTTLSKPEIDTSCFYYGQNETTGQIEEMQCKDWDFDNKTFVSTVTSEYGLVCQYKYLRASYQSMYMFGMLVGAGFNGFLADKFGRWTMISIATVSYTIIALGSAWLPTMSTLLIARFMLGTMHPTSLQTGYILVLEVTEPKMRSKVGLFQFITWSFGTMLFSAWAYFIREWRWLQTAVSLPCFLFLPALWFLGESPRWMAVVGQHKRALNELKRAAKWNKVKLPSDEKLLAIMKKVQEQAVSARDHGSSKGNSKKSLVKAILDRTIILFRTPKLRLISIIMCIDYFIVAMTFFGLTLGASSIGVDPFIYVAVMAAAEFPSNTILIPLVTYLGRKKGMMLEFFICSASLLLQPLISEDLKWLSVVLIMIGKMFSSAAFNCLFLYSLELIPTELRTQGMGAGMMASRAGAIIAPFIMSALDKYPWGISVVFGCAAFLAGIAVIPLWETQNTTLPDTVAELEGYTQKKDKNISNGVNNPIPVDDNTPC